MDANLAQALKNILDLHSDCEVDVYGDYSGRNMHGKTTTGLTGVTTVNILEAVITAVAEDCHTVKELRDCMEHVPKLLFEQDQLGLSHIVY